MIKVLHHPILSRLLIGIYLLAIGFFAIFPFFWLAVSSLKPPSEIFSEAPTLLPQTLHLDGYKQILSSDSNFLTAMKNSLVVGSATAFLSCLLALFTAYSLMQFKLPGSRPFAISLFMTQMFPQAVILVPLFILFQDYNLYDTLPALVLANMAFSIPVAVWLLMGFMESIPSELIDAARIDGATHFGLMFRIIVPVSQNGIIAVIMWLFIRVWGELLFAVTFTTSQDTQTLQVFLAAFRGEYNTDWSGMLATSTLTALPVIIIFLLLQRFFASGLVSGAIKG
ncbi:MAG: Inner membrane ABC transporter permease protein YcjP [Nitrosomonadaceae bacterium]|nr:Inner membrane ABC transporter permease protein YcjP [Nitrosomonadaceae bacterium]